MHRVRLTQSTTQPLNSRFIVSTPGNDRELRNKIDDARAEVRINSSGEPVLTAIVGESPLGALRDPTSLAPRGWIYPRHVVLWNA